MNFSQHHTILYCMFMSSQQSMFVKQWQPLLTSAQCSPSPLSLFPTVVFSQGSPFRPFQQLLAVLPSASSQLLPAPFQPLMLNPDSPILDFYPLVFDVDMEGKRAEWEGVVKVPFVDEVRNCIVARIR